MLTYKYRKGVIVTKVTDEQVAHGKKNYLFFNR